MSIVIIDCYVTYTGSVRSTVEPKQVMFSDGIRPGGDLTELDGVESASPPVQSAARRKKVDKSGRTWSSNVLMFCFTAASFISMFSMSQSKLLLLVCKNVCTKYVTICEVSI